MAKKRSKQSTASSRKKKGIQEEKRLLDNDEMQGNEDDTVEIWDVKHAYTAAQRALSCAKKCMGENCSNVAVSAWASSKDPGNHWEACEDCLKIEFGGWPDDFEFPEGFQVDDDEGRKTDDKETELLPSDGPSETEPPSAGIMAASTSTMGVDTPIDSNLEQHEQAQEQETTPPYTDDESVEIWDIKHAYTAKERSASCAKMCMSDECRNVAFAAWVSNKDPDNHWETCEDCQVRDFGGWPEDFELPDGFHDDDEDDEKSDSSAVVPVKDAHNPTSITKMKNRPASQITPPPNCVFAASDSTIAEKKSSKEGAGTFISPVTNNSNKPSAAAIAMHKKWQEAAESMNGGSSDVRIVLSKPSAKKLIYDCLYDAFAPMNITDVYKSLKAVVPSPILSACLDEMVFSSEESFEDEDDIEGNTKKAKYRDSDSLGDPYAATVLMKDGRNVSSNLYFLDQSKLDNNGNGLPAEDLNELLRKMDQSSSEEIDLQNKLNKLIKDATVLEMEPTNEDAEQQVQKQIEDNEDLEKRLAQFRLYPTNAKVRKELQKKIQYFATHWKNKKRTCIDFLFQMEECTDGSVSMKKCFTGDGVIELDSDEAIIKSAIDYAEKKKKQKLSHGKAATEKLSASIPPDNNFVAVYLESSLAVRRIYLNE